MIFNYKLKKDVLGGEKKNEEGCEKVMEKWKKLKIGGRRLIVMEH